MAFFSHSGGCLGAGHSEQGPRLPAGDEIAGAWVEKELDKSCKAKGDSPTL